MEGSRGLYREHVQRNKNHHVCVCVCARPRARFRASSQGAGSKCTPGVQAQGAPPQWVWLGGARGGAGTHTNAW